MFDLSTLMLFSAAAFALTISPGPDMMLIAARSAAQGRVAGLATWAGIAAGTYVHALAAALGLSQLFLAVPVAYDLVRYAGAAYLLYLAYRTFTASTVVEFKSQKHDHFSTAKMFRQGFWTNMLNPKMALFVLALFPQFVIPDAGSVALQIMILATILNVIGFFIKGVVILTASGLSRALSTSTGFRLITKYLLGTVFAGLAFRLAFDNQR
jgi:threonine/homoserine/homoserine lactone efflux protein